MNYEFCKALYDRGNVIKASQITLQPTEEERYISMFGFDNSIYEHLELSKTWNKDKDKNPKPTVSKFKGNYYCKFVYLDIDSENLQEAHDMAKNLTIMLHNNLGINPKALIIAFSGGKGFHIGLPSTLFGGMEPSKDLPNKVRTLVIKLLCECFEVSLESMQEAIQVKGNKQLYNLIDLSIYNDNRIFRALNSKNHKGGRYKIGLTYEELHSLSIDEIVSLANAPKEYKSEIPANQIQPIPELVNLWAETLKFNEAEYHAQYKASSAGAKAYDKSQGSTIFYLPMSGGRNNAFFKQAAHLFDHSELTKNQVYQLLKCVNLSCVPPLPDNELYNTVNSAYKHTIDNKVKSKEPLQIKEIEIFNDWLDEWAEYYASEPKPMTYLFDEIDKDQEYNFTGKLACLIGQGGTKKSFLALNIVAENVLSQNARVIYSSMEMGKVELVNRLIDIYFAPENGVPASKLSRQRLKNEGSEYITQIKQAINGIDDKLILSNVGSKTSSDYHNDWQKTVELYGPVDFLVVDGLSMMGGKGSEMERFEQHTKELKALANKTGMNIILICHTTKEAKQYTRDCMSFARGSGKIFDNCDFTISLSNLIDDTRSTPESIEFMPCMGHIKYYNKRGTGLMYNSCYDFSPVTKKISRSAREPKHFPEYDAFVKSYNAKQKSKSKDEEPQPF